MMRKPTRNELSLFYRESNKWDIFSIFSNKLIVIKEERIKNGTRKLLFLIPNNLEKLIYFTHTYRSGLFLGTINIKKFYPSFPFLYLVTKFGINYPYILLNTQAEILFLYGRDILGESILEYSTGLKENCLVIVLNTNKELLGIGRTRFSDELIQNKGKITISNLMDLGLYHRNENKRDQSSFDLSYFID